MSPTPETCLWAFDISSDGTVQELVEGTTWGPIPDGGYRWIHFDREEAATVRWVRDPKSGVHSFSAEAFLAVETRPRVAVTEDELLVVLRGVNLNPGADPEDMVSLRVLIEPGRVITSRRRRVLAMQDLRDQIREGRPPANTSHWLAQLVERLLDRMSEPLENLDDRFDELELDALDAPAAELRRDLSEARRAAVTLRRHLSPQRDVIQRLAQDPLLPLDERGRLRLRESADRIARYLEDLEANRDRALVTQEELTAKLAESMNRTSYRLTIVAAIFLPLGFLTGLLGINVGGIPLAESSYGFAIVCGMMVMVTVGQLVYFKRQRWW